MEPALRISGTKPYFFSTLGPYLHDLRSLGVDVIRLDMGSPDLPPAPFIVQKLVEEAMRGDSHGYSPYGGTLHFRRAIGEYYRKRFAVDLDPYSEILGLIGSKEGIFNLSQALLNPGDLVLVPDPGYPTYSSGARIAGADIHFVPLREDAGYLPVFEDIPLEAAQRAKILWLNYPNNPTGAVADLAFFERAVDFAREHRIVLIHDAPYVEIGYRGYRAPSMLQVPSAKEVAVELNSLSKSYNMAGWRLGMTVGNAEVISYLHTLKVEIDSSNFGPSQMAGAAALTGDQAWVAERNAEYEIRRDIAVAGLKEAGFTLATPEASLYVWARLPDGIDEMDFCHRLVTETGISLTPGAIFGDCGKGYIRVTLCTPSSRIREAMERLVDWVGSAGIDG